jgi:hypothetical protein
MARTRLWAGATAAVLGLAGIIILVQSQRDQPSSVESVETSGAGIANAQRSSEEQPAGRTEEQTRRALFAAVQPVRLENCEMQRFGEAHDGGYLMCGNLLTAVQSAYSYGIGGYDGWGCDVSRKLSVKVHQYDCFDRRRPSCPGGDTVFHDECVSGEARVDQGRRFETVERQLATNGDAGKHLVVKMDVEGAEWDSWMQTPDAVLDRIDQIAMEFHGVKEERFIVVVERLKKFFHIAHLHFNNHACSSTVAPFPAWAFEVLLVNKRIGVLDPSGAAGGPHPLDAPSAPQVPDCQTARR